MENRKSTNKTGRDRKSGFYLNLMQQEVELLKKKSESYGMTRSEYLRNLIVFGSVRAQSKLSDSQFQDLLNELNHIGVNINQIARSVNAGIARAADARRGLFLLDQVYELMYQIAKK